MIAQGKASEHSLEGKSCVDPENNVKMYALKTAVKTGLAIEGSLFSPTLTAWSP